ncbi:ATP-binding protein [Sphaerisporangium sp. NPDC049002]|uniref:ATP-binding protein n=1 Tax=Sphaerisporangium sp. NPDC049002 TaxID=3155392 RepID=UPI0033EE188D
MKGLGLLGRVDVPARVTAVPAARRCVRELLGGTDHPQTDDALLLVTELVTNAVRYSDSGRCPAGRVTIAVADHDGTLHVDVTDAGSSENRPTLCQETRPDSGGGRGLWLLQQVATTWGWYETATGRVVWFQLAGK